MRRRRKRKEKAGTDQSGSGRVLVSSCPSSLPKAGPFHLHGLARQDARRNEEKKFLRRGADSRVLEQIADDRQAAEERHLLDVRPLVVHDNPADDDGFAVATVTLVSAACVSMAGMPCTRGIEASIWSFSTVTSMKMFPSAGDLRGHVEFQHRVNELHGNRVVDDGLHRDLGTLLDSAFWLF